MKTFIREINHIVNGIQFPPKMLIPFNTKISSTVLFCSTVSWIKSWILEHSRNHKNERNDCEEFPRQCAWSSASPSWL